LLGQLKQDESSRARCLVPGIDDSPADTLEGRFGKKLRETFLVSAFAPFSSFLLLQQHDSFPHSLVCCGKTTVADMLEDKGFLIGCEVDVHLQSMEIFGYDVNHFGAAAET
jgi:hypothetical protein